MRIEDDNPAALKKAWVVNVPGYAPFTMVLQEDLDRKQATLQARVIWPRATCK